MDRYEKLRIIIPGEKDSRFEDDSENKECYTTKLLTEEFSLAAEEGAFYRRRERVGFKPFRR